MKGIYEPWYNRKNLSQAIFSIAMAGLRPGELEPTVEMAYGHPRLLMIEVRCPSLRSQREHYLQWMSQLRQTVMIPVTLEAVSGLKFMLE
jgi:hypothetical protein